MKLEELYISHNALTRIENLAPNLKNLDISSNAIEKLENIGHLTGLVELWASNNKFDSFQDIETMCGDKKYLETVYFEGNPVQKLNETTYRNKIRMCVGQVKQIDANYI